jgi:AcrR family transcriptional regulator
MPGTRRSPCQARGEKRVAELLEAAVVEFSRAGYEAATMSAIAARAGAPIGSLYQFFPNKEAVARAVRTRHIEDIEDRWGCLTEGRRPMAVKELVRRFVDLMIGFVHEHPAFLPLQDAPSSTQPIGARKRLRGRIEDLLLAQRPRMGRATAARMAGIVLHMNKAIMGLYAASAPLERERIAEEYRAALGAYLATRLGAAPERRRAREV